MFNNSLEGILKSFTKVQNRLDAFATAQEAEAEKKAQAALVASSKATSANLQAAKARRISGNIDTLLSA